MELEAIVGLTAAIILFLYGVDHLSRELQRIASDRLRAFLQRLTSSRWSGAAAGALSTAAMQSSTATTVITIGLVNAGIISFSQSLGIIAGANVGTTITAQLIAFRFVALAPLLLVAGFFMSLFGARLKILGKAVFYFGFLLLTIGLISQSIAPFKENPSVTQTMQKLGNPLLGVLVGMAFTLLFQSSSATTGIAVVLGAEGILGLTAAIPIIMGANIGTTATALLSSWKMDMFAKRTAVAHTLFNVCGVLLFLPLIPHIAAVIETVGGNTGQMIANAHTLFNLASAFIFLLMLGQVEKITARILPGKEREIIFRAEYIEEVPGNTDKAIAAVKKELGRQLELVQESFQASYRMVRNAKADKIAKVKKLETLNDYLDKRISEVLVELSLRDLTEKQSGQMVMLARLSNEVEEMGDLSEDFSELAERLDERGEKLLPEAVAELDRVKEGFDLIMERVIERKWSMDKKTFMYLSAKRAKADRLIQKAYKTHIKRLADNKLSSLASTIFVDAIHSMEDANSALLRISRILMKLGKGRGERKKPVSSIP